MAQQLAEAEYDKYHAKRVADMRTRESDFDKAVKLIEDKKPRKIENAKRKRLER